MALYSGKENLNTLFVHAGILPQWSVTKTLELAHELEKVLRHKNYAKSLVEMYGNTPNQWNDKLKGAERLRVIINSFARLRFCTAKGVMEFASKEGAGDADLFCCGLVTLIQSLGATQWFGIRLPVMMGVTFASVAPMVAMANANPGEMGAQMIFGAIIGAGVISILIAPVVSRMLRFFPPVVTGTIIAVIGVSLMRIGINWIFGNPVGPTAPSIVNPEHKQWLDAAAAAANAPGSTLPAIPKDLALLPKMPNPKYADLTGVGIAGLVLVTIMLISKFAKGFVANISVLLGIVVGGIVAVMMGLMNFDKVGKAAWFDVVLPFHFGPPVFEPVLILTMTLVMIVVMIETAPITRG